MQSVPPLILNIAVNDLVIRDPIQTLCGNLSDGFVRPKLRYLRFQRKVFLLQPQDLLLHRRRLLLMLRDARLYERDGEHGEHDEHQQYVLRDARRFAFFHRRFPPSVFLVLLL